MYKCVSQKYFLYFFLSRYHFTSPVVGFVGSLRLFHLLQGHFVSKENVYYNLSFIYVAFLHLLYWL